MPDLLFDPNLFRDIEGARGFLERQDFSLIAGESGTKILAQARSLRPAVLVLSGESFDFWPHLDELRSDPEHRRLKILLLVSNAIPAPHREALVGADVSLLNAPVTPEALANAVAAVMNIPTRVTVRTRVAFEVTGRTADNAVVFGRMLDISTGGFRLESESAFDPGQTLYCFFALGPSTPVIFATARLVHSRETAGSRHEHGLEFVEIRLDDRRRIAEFVFRQSGLSAVLR